MYIYANITEIFETGADDIPQYTNGLCPLRNSFSLDNSNYSFKILCVKEYSVLYTE